MNPLQALETCGQSPWLDYLKRSFVAGGDLKRLIEEDGLKGVTSNPSIFQKAIGESEEYAADLEAFLKTGDLGVAELYERLAVGDIQAAADVLKGVYLASGGLDGYVSLECSPYVADDTAATVREAVHLWETVDRPNLMVKVPGTPAGIPAIQELIGRGINVNVTLLFAVEAYEAVVEAYLSGLETLQRRNGPVGRVASVASFFVSRIDAAVDKRLAAAGSEAAARLKGRIAIANAKRAYQRYKALFDGPRWGALAVDGAKPQRLLWASTSTKDPSLRDTLYVEALVGRETVDTLPPATLEAFRDHGEVRADAVEADLEAAEADLHALEGLGISLKEVTAELLEDGVRQFADAFDKLLGSVAHRRRAALLGGADPDALVLKDPATADAYAAELERFRTLGVGRRLWSLDETLWTGRGEAQWGAWLTVVERQRAALPDLEAFAAEVRARGVRDVLLLGMGGSSLGPEVLGAALGGEGVRLLALDSTSPDELAARRAEIDIAKTLFVVSSKSGGTLEPNLFLDYFFAEASAALGPADAAKAFVAVTDPGSSLERRARELGFWRIFPGEPQIGGRFSVLSNFGLVPAAAAGIDVGRLLDRAARAVRDCGADAPPAENPGLRLGALLGACARLGRDKVTLFASPGLGGAPAWLEQLLAESTGKNGRGLIPVADEPLGAPQAYGPDRLFVDLRLAGEAEDARSRLLRALADLGHPTLTITLKDPFDLAGEFFRWEVATAAAGAALAINPFDQPDVESAKVKARERMAAIEGGTSAEPGVPLFETDVVSVFADGAARELLADARDLPGALGALLRDAAPPAYGAILAYVERNAAHAATLDAARARIRDRTRMAACLGFGPRFLHSTGQAYKGGPAGGVFLVITAAPARDVPVPGKAYGFGAVQAAQAVGDLEALVERGRRALRIHLRRGPQDLALVTDALASALA